MQSMNIRIGQLSLGSIIKLVFLCNLFLWILASILFDLSCAVSPSSCTVNEGPYTLGASLGVSLLMVPLLSIAGTVACTIGALVVRLVNHWVPFGRLTVFTESQQGSITARTRGTPGSQVR